MGLLYQPMWGEGGVRERSLTRDHPESPGALPARRTQRLRPCRPAPALWAAPPPGKQEREAFLRRNLCRRTFIQQNTAKYYSDADI